MVGIKSTLLALGVAGAANAFINGIQVPANFQVAQNAKLPITLVHSSSAQDHLDYSMVVSVQPAEGFNPGSKNLGDHIVRVFNLKHLDLESLNDDTHTLQVPLGFQEVAGFQSGAYIVSAAVTRGAGIGYGAGVSVFTAPVQLQI